jgi:hypothetical protein
MASDPTPASMEALVLNPCVELIRRRRDGELRAIAVVAPVKGERLRMTNLARDREPALFAFAAAVASGSAHAELEAPLLARLVDIGLLVPAGRAPAPVRFHCSLEDAPADLAAPSRRERLRVDASLRYQDEPRPPDEARVPSQSLWLRDVPVARPEVNPFAAGCAWAFFDHAEAEAPGVLSVAEGDRALFRSLTPGAPPPADLPAERVASLAAAGVLVDPDDADRRRRARVEQRVEVAARVERDHQAVLPGLLHPGLLAALRRYYRALIAEGHLSFGDSLVSRRYWAHNEALARWLHRRLAPLASEVAGKPLQPAFLFFASYRPGATLPPHRDRDPCELSINVMLDYAPEPEGVTRVTRVTPWPLFLAGDDGVGRPAELGLGDALFYRGKQLLHWRDPLPEGHASTSVIFNYAGAGYAGSLD